MKAKLAQFTQSEIYVPEISIDEDAITDRRRKRSRDQERKTARSRKRCDQIFTTAAY